ncbi:hypothetical protein PHMEG_00021096 [Phytophthora megakarya]|uniref:Uncharacterized protein n=1 Tax=Phytophthora megakarya TaxID=4795 RepID=A0A225VQ15_9STRA|nr:hypothetical protein PHMEG_00021096 [Phytophthora megakarya]
MKARNNEEDEDHPESGWSEEGMKSMYHRKELRDFVDQDPMMRMRKLKQTADPKHPLTAPAALTNRLDAAKEPISLLKEALDLDVIQTTSRDFFQTLKILVGEVPQSPDPLPLTTTYGVDNLTVSSHYASAAEDGSDFLGATATDVPRTLWASMLEARSKIRRFSPAKSNHCDNGSAPTDQDMFIESSDRSVGTLQKFFDGAMDRYLAEEREANKDPASTRPQHQGSQDVEMESTRSSDHGSR